MTRRRLALTALLATAAFSPRASAQQSAQHRDRAVHVKHVNDPTLEALDDADKAAERKAQATTEKIDKTQEVIAKKEKDQRQDLRIDLEGLVKPSSPTAFEVQAWHLPPVAQYLTSTCWSFSTTSFFESEIHRLTGRSVDLSEMWTVYWEFVEKARRYVKTRGHSAFGEGSESEALPRIWKQYGVVPASAYPGILRRDGKYDHEPMFKELERYLEYCKANNYWDEDQVLGTVKLILDRTMGAPPASFVYEGETYTPKQFLTKVTKLSMDDYVSFMSTTSLPFWAKGEYKVPDNWGHERSYYNVPLDVWYGALLGAVKAGSTVAIGGDVSEPGYDGWNKVAVVPTFDVPAAFIDQDSRELRFYERSSTDDHGVHLVGWLRLDGHDWFLIKDSARMARKAKPHGYLYYRDDYVKLKMLTFMVHKDFVKDVLAKCHRKRKTRR